MSSKIPNKWFCPITIQLMINHVIGSDGHTYEKEYIEKWLRNNNTSPITKAPMFIHELIPNIALRNTIQEFTSNKKVSFNESVVRIMPNILTDNKITSSYIVSKQDDNLNVNQCFLLPLFVLFDPLFRPFLITFIRTVFHFLRGLLTTS